MAGRPSKHIGCSVAGCTEPHRSRGMCHKHYKKWLAATPPEQRQPLPTTEERFWARVTITGACWQWTGARSDTGYGSFHVDGSTWTGAHRFAYATLVGQIPEGMQLDHLCRNRTCVNPDHLEVVTATENTLRIPRGVALAACRKGHLFTEENTYWNKGVRSCRECKRIANRRAKQKKRVAA